MKNDQFIGDVLRECLTFVGDPALRNDPSQGQYIGGRIAEALERLGPSSHADCNNFEGYCNECMAKQRGDSCRESKR